jgi:hypothetical protein
MEQRTGNPVPGVVLLVSVATVLLGASGWYVWAGARAAGARPWAPSVPMEEATSRLAGTSDAPSRAPIPGLHHTPEPAAAGPAARPWAAMVEAAHLVRSAATAAPSAKPSSGTGTSRLPVAPPAAAPTAPETDPPATQPGPLDLRLAVLTGSGDDGLLQELGDLLQLGRPSR